LVWIYAFGKRFPYYDPTLLGFYRLGFLTGLCGFFLGIGAKGKLRWPAVAAGIFMAAAWFLAASQE
jgi:hypothetical protein